MLNLLCPIPNIFTQASSSVYFICHWLSFFFFFESVFLSVHLVKITFSGTYGEEGTENILAANVPHTSSRGAKKEETLNVVINMVKIAIVIFYLY